MQELLVPALAAAVAGAVWATARPVADTAGRLTQGVFMVSGVTTAVGLAGALVFRHPIAAGAAAAAGLVLHLVARRQWPTRSARALTLQALGLMVVALTLGSIGL
ncbi:MAG: hypothetical protein JWM80_37 [Cyanobacteria bacterium RYN_339]|nr:hypothetical protein [Cyanobacteria bacterium RYN_339]